MLGPAENTIAEVLALGKSVIAALLVLSSLIVSALALFPAGSLQTSDQGSAELPAGPIAYDPTKAPVIGTIVVSPSVLNLNSGGKYVTVHLELPDGYSVSSVYIPSLRFMGIVYAETCFSDHETGADKENAPHMMLKFLRAEVKAVLSPGDDVSVFVSGMLVDGTPLYASGVMAVTG